MILHRWSATTGDSVAVYACFSDVVAGFVEVAVVGISVANIVLLLVAAVAFAMSLSAGTAPAAARIMLLYCKENSIYVFLFWELRGLSPNFHVHVSVSDLHIPHISSCSRIGRPIMGIYKSLTDI